ncbi:MAG: RT0821/Lpp0805 family surface protein [Rhodospirillales bacterium]|nr:RT0821/Lpp0805 family surface protein [Rhodospirillales bacterium]MCW8861065.1 RT0821/Lpp0805 family surface protein [Rhodospirillales bacterium]MCW8952579.1 RT0821/Lpp0805 family surface protein [Rhodospirillales bacterium]MCW8970761.1 RT0821/Lpp0805 family surface protein [Rhodospirillales bacterium]MCW9002383.1 RT0821/Lpp0805 family surface protein [Rhodospirillales bacterium]
MNFTRIPAIALSLGLLAGCQTMGDIFTGPLYDKLTPTDAEIAASTMQATLEKEGDGRSRSWTNTTSGNSGSVTVVATRVTEKGVFCRDYKETLNVGKESSTQSMTACRTDKGAWVWPE